MLMLAFVFQTLASCKPDVDGAMPGPGSATTSGSLLPSATGCRRGWVTSPTSLKELHAIGPPPYPASSVFTERTWLQRFARQLRPKALWAMGKIALGGTESSVIDLPNLVRGFRFSMDAMWPEVSRLNLLDIALALQMPVFFFLGRRDHWVPPETSVTYFDALTAPSKNLMWFEDSGHEPFMDEPEKFNRLMVELVWPISKELQ
jgi:pimeloyl-ACP methyl ester carboxylesterase